MDTNNIKKIDLFYLNIIIEELNILNIEIDIKELIKLEAQVIPIMSYNSYDLDTKFGNLFLKNVYSR